MFSFSKIIYASIIGRGTITDRTFQDFAEKSPTEVQHVTPTNTKTNSENDEATHTETPSSSNSLSSGESSLDDDPGAESGICLDFSSQPDGESVTELTELTLDDVQPPKDGHEFVKPFADLDLPVLAKDSSDHNSYGAAQCLDLENIRFHVAENRSEYSTANNDKTPKAEEAPLFSNINLTTVSNESRPHSAISTLAFHSKAAVFDENLPINTRETSIANNPALNSVLGVAKVRDRTHFRIPADLGASVHSFQPVEQQHKDGLQETDQEHRQEATYQTLAGHVMDRIMTDIHSTFHIETSAEATEDHVEEIDLLSLDQSTPLSPPSEASQITRNEDTQSIFSLSTPPSTPPLSVSSSPKLGPSPTPAELGAREEYVFARIAKNRAISRELFAKPIRSSTPAITLKKPCLQCVIKDMPCDQRAPSCSRCIRSGHAQYCLVQRHLAPFEQKELGVATGCVDVVRQPSDDDAIWKRKLELENLLLHELQERIDRRNWVCPVNDGVTEGWKVRDRKFGAMVKGRDVDRERGEEWTYKSVRNDLSLRESTGIESQTGLWGLLGHT